LTWPLKYNYEVGGRYLRSWTGTAYPSKGLLFAYGDGTIPAGNTHTCIVAFGAEAERLHAEEDIERRKKMLYCIFMKWTLREW
jgi:hypothetical protein